MYPQTQKGNIDGVNLQQVLYVGHLFLLLRHYFFNLDRVWVEVGEGRRGIGVHVKETQKCSSNPKNTPNFFENPNPPTFLPTNVFTHQRLLDDCT